MSSYTNFFRINMPYGVIVKANGELICFNRNYAPIGHFSTIESCITWINESELPIFGSYEPISDDLLRKIAIDHRIDVWEDDSRVIHLYLDESNPTDKPMSDKKWKAYFERIKLLVFLGAFERTKTNLNF